MERIAPAPTAAIDTPLNNHIQKIKVENLNNKALAYYMVIRKRLKRSHSQYEVVQIQVTW